MNTDSENKNTKDTICEYLKEGLYKKDAASMAGIDESTFYRWIKEDASFASRVEASILEYKRSLIQNVNKVAENNAGVALQILRLRWPQDWDKPQYEDKRDSSVHQLAADMLQMIIEPGHEIERLGGKTEGLEEIKSHPAIINNTNGYT
jgi:hypothetical protein